MDAFKSRVGSVPPVLSLPKGSRCSAAQRGLYWASNQGFTGADRPAKTVRWAAQHTDIHCAISISASLLNPSMEHENGQTDWLNMLVFALIAQEQAIRSSPLSSRPWPPWAYNCMRPRQTQKVLPTTESTETVGI